MDQPRTAVSPTPEASGTVFRACCWGTRGSIASPGPQTAGFGGNTPCISIEAGGGKRLVLDAGTGIRALGTTMVGGEEPPDAVIFLSHFHWDHIQGFPFFAPLYNPEATLRIIGPKQFELDVQTLFAGQMGPIYFPIPFEALSAQKVFSHLEDAPWEEAGVVVSSMRVQHPSFTVGYRVDHEGGSLAYVPDNELSGDLYGLDEAWRSRFLDFIGDVDVLIHDAMYTDEEYPRRVGWGHSTFNQAIELAHEAGVKKILFFRHWRRS
jgi:phosphoribosyl 1,2-cyclic phosphodiesterase